MMKIRKSQLKALIEEVLEEGADEKRQIEKYKNSMKNINRKAKQIEMALKQKAIGGKRAYIMESIHGLIVGFEDIRFDSSNKTVRFSGKDLAQFARLKLRWLDVSSSQQMVAVGI